MNKDLRAIIVTLACTALLTFSIGAQQPAARPVAPELQLARLSQISKDAQKSRQMATLSPVDFGWLLFVLENWPSLAGQRGVPDGSKPFGAPGPVVWQTWKTAPEVYVAPNQTPLPWNLGLAGTPVLAQGEIDGRTLLDVNNNPVMYQVLMNQPTFNYLVSQKLYSFAGQEAARNNISSQIRFPSDALEVKASWRILDPVADQTRISHYLTQRVTYTGSDGSKLQLVVGLTGLHIASKVLPKWFWVTFEQTENAATTKTKLNLPIPPDVAAGNAKMQRLLGGTFWQYYMMDGYQTEFLAAGKPTLLANSQIETNFQSSSSCITCHALASIGAANNPGGARFAFFKNFQGYIGAPPTSPFGPGPQQYTQLDYVWSMREAQRPAAKNPTTTSKEQVR